MNFLDKINGKTLLIIGGVVLVIAIGLVVGVMVTGGV